MVNQHKEKYEVVTACKEFVQVGLLKNPMTLDEARAHGQQEVLAKPGWRYIGILNVDVTKDEIRAMGYLLE